MRVCVSVLKRQRERVSEYVKTPHCVSQICPRPFTGNHNMKQEAGEAPYLEMEQRERERERNKECME